MSRRKGTTKAQSDGKKRAKAKPEAVPASVAGQASLTGLTSSPMSALSSGSIEAQAARLGDPRLQTVQRQALAAEIGRVQGNRQLQRVVKHLNRQGKSGSTAQTSKDYSQPVQDSKRGVLAPRLRSEVGVSRHGGNLQITALNVTNATATATDLNTFVTTRNSPAGNVVVDAVLNPAHGSDELADHRVRWRGGRAGANGLQRLVPVGSAGRKSITLTADGNSRTIRIYVVNATPPPGAIPPALLRHIRRGRSNPGTNFGLTVVTIGQQGVTRPVFGVTAHLDGNQWRFRVTDIRHYYKIGVRSQGRKDIAGPGDSDIRPNTIVRIISDLTPPAPGTAHGPPRTRYWSRAITQAHEQAHVDRFYTNAAFWPTSMRRFENEVETATVNFDPGTRSTRSARAVINSQRAHWRTRIEHFHNQADAAEIPTSETATHGVSNPMYTVLINSIRNTVAPPAPRNVVANPVAANSITLTWTQDAANETGFVIERRQGRGGFTPIANVGRLPTTFTDAGLQPNTRYTYRIAATSAAGDSAYSRRVTATTPP